jgi:hypothetical protein
MRTIVRILFVVAVTAAVSLVSVARASLFTISFTDGGANTGFGEIEVNSQGYAISGSFNVEAGAANISPLTWNLYTAGGTIGTSVLPTWNKYLTSPLGAFWYDNKVYLNPTDPNDNPQEHGSYFDNPGILFTDSKGDELNLWGNGGNNYSLYAVIGGVSYNPAVNSASLQPIGLVPEPINCALAGFGLIFAGVGVGRFYLGRLRKA